MHAHQGREQAEIIIIIRISPFGTIPIHHICLKNKNNNKQHTHKTTTNNNNNKTDCISKASVLGDVFFFSKNLLYEWTSYRVTIIFLQRISFRKIILSKAFTPQNGSDIKLLTESELPNGNNFTLLLGTRRNYSIKNGHGATRTTNTFLCPTSLTTK